MNISKSRISPGIVIKSNSFPEPVRIITCDIFSNSLKIEGVGVNTGEAYNRVLSEFDLQRIEIISSIDDKPQGDANKFRLGVEALRLGLAYEYDPYFSLSIARVDPLPHQLEAVYDYFLKLPQIRFLLADDPGAGKTIMAGLLIKELKIRGLIKRVLIITPANLTFQWQRELADKFREQFEIVNGNVLRANYGINAWQERNQVITSLPWVSVIEDAKQSLLRSHWDLIIVDEAHKMSARSEEHKTLAYQLGENLSNMTDHFLLMTATPHKGDPKQFRLFLELLDKDVYGDIESLQEAINRHEAPFYLRRIKEALVTFPDPETGQVKSLFTKRIVKTIDFQISNAELEFYDSLTRYVEDQSIKAAAENSTRGRAVGFTMAMLQRRFASSIRAVRKSLERMKDKREKILEDPEGYKQKQIETKLPDDFDDMTDEEQQKLIDSLESQVLTYDPEVLRDEIIEITKLIEEAILIEEKEVETKLAKLKEFLMEKGMFNDPKMKLLIFTEHKDTLDYLVEKLEEWNLTVTKIHGGMPIGDRNTPFTRIFAENEFRDACQILVATEAAGEGINLQFCWFMINYDIPWNPMRLEQRMGRIHRYGQEKDCLIFNFVTTNTREGRVLAKLFERIKRIEEDLDPDKTGKVFNVLGEIFSSNLLEKMIRDMYSHNLTEDVIKTRIVENVDTARFKNITDSALEGLAKKQLNLSAIIGKSEEAKERRLVPEVIEDFFVSSSPIIGINPKSLKTNDHIYQIGRIPRNLWTYGDNLENRFGKLAHEYRNIAFDKSILSKESTTEWVTPGHPLFETARNALLNHVQNDLHKGAIFYDLHRNKPARLDVFSISVKDGRNNTLHKRLFVTQISNEKIITVHQPTIFLDLSLAPSITSFDLVLETPVLKELEKSLYEQSLLPFLEEIKIERLKEIETIKRHIELSLKAIIDKEQIKFCELEQQKQNGSLEPGLDGRIKQSADRLEELNERLERRLKEIEQEGNCTIADIQHIGFAWVLPHPDRNTPQIASMIRDDEIEKLAVKKVIEYEQSKGWIVESVEKENRGFDLISRKPHPEDSKTNIEVRFIEVKGRSEVGEIALTTNEYKTAQRLKKDYWLYTVFNCASNPEIHIIQDPAILGWEAIVKVEHYHISSQKILNAER